MESAEPSHLDIDVLLPAGMRAPGLARWLQSVAPARARGSVSIAVVSDARVRGLNRDYRRKDATTDVLSFPADVDEAGLTSPAPRHHRRCATLTGSVPPDHGRGAGLVNSLFLGDIVIASGAARRQARQAGHSLQTELRILALHGLLHLLGYDHEQDNGQMARLERRLRRSGGLREGLIERATEPSEPPAVRASRP
jgi:probable rRNA maturation factor